MGQIWDRKFPIPFLSHFRHNIKPDTLRKYKNVYLLCFIHPVMIYHGLWVVCSNLPKYTFLRGDVLTYPFKRNSPGTRIKQIIVYEWMTSHSDCSLNKIPAYLGLKSNKYILLIQFWTTFSIPGWEVTMMFSKTKSG